jgi:PAS domain S-box-containing protein
VTVEVGTTDARDELPDPFFRRAFEAMSQAVVVTDLQCRVRYWNLAAEHRSGYTAAEALGRELAALIEPTRI